MFLRLYTSFEFLLDGENSYFYIKVKVLGIVIWKKQILFSEEDLINPNNGELNSDREAYRPSNFSSKLQQFKELLFQLIDAKPLVLKVLSRINIHRLYWKTYIGTGDASATGILCGALWGMKGSIVGLITNYMNILQKPMIEVNPTFQEKRLYSECSGMVSARLGQTIYTFVQLIKYVNSNHSNWANEPA